MILIGGTVGDYSKRLGGWWSGETGRAVFISCLGSIISWLLTYLCLKLYKLEYLKEYIGIYISIATGIVCFFEFKRYTAYVAFKKASEGIQQIDDWIKNNNPVSILFSTKNKLLDDNAKQLNRILNHSSGENHLPFWANIYLMRSMSPSMVLNPEEDESRLLLLRGIEEITPPPHNANATRQKVVNT